MSFEKLLLRCDVAAPRKWLQSFFLATDPTKTPPSHKTVKNVAQPSLVLIKGQLGEEQ